MIKVVCVDESEGGQNGLKLLTNGKVYEAFTSEDFQGTHMGTNTPNDCYYIVADDGFPIMPLRIYFKPLRENNLNELLDESI